MRRTLAWLLMLLFSVGPLTATLQGDDDSRLPACCRRHGAHHCAMSEAMRAQMTQSAQTADPAWTAPDRCPFYPQHLAANVAPQSAIAASLHSFALTRLRRQPLERATLILRSQPLSRRCGRSPPSSELL